MSLMRFLEDRLRDKIKPNGRIQLYATKKTSIEDIQCFVTQFKLDPVPLDAYEEFYDEDKKKAVYEAFKKKHTPTKFQLESELFSKQKKMLSERFMSGRLQTFKDIDRPNEFILFDSESRNPWNFEPEAIFSVLDKDQVTEVKFKAPLARLRFDAFEDYRIKSSNTEDGFPFAVVNTYTKPKWQEKFGTNVEMDERFKRFMEIFVPNEEHRKMTYSWMSHALIKRHQNFLSLRGTRGNGKSTFCNIFGLVTGRYVQPNDDFMLKDFNAEIKNKRLVVFDDDSSTTSRKGAGRRKKIANKIITYNEKNIQTKEHETNYSSFILCSNTDTAFHLNYDERRLVQPDLCETDLKDTEMGDLLNFFYELPDLYEQEDEEAVKFVAGIGSYLHEIYGTDNYGESSQLRNDVFWEDVIDSLNAFPKYVATNIVSKEYEEEVRFSYLKEEFLSEKSSHSKTTSFLNLYKHLREVKYKDENLVVGYEEVDSDYILNINKIFINIGQADKFDKVDDLMEMDI